jgi:hypothetical protein
LWILGYSWGGAIAPLLGEMFGTPNNLPDVTKVITLGAPRCTVREHATVLSRTLQIVRYMMWNDPIPVCPVRSSDSTWAAVYYGTTRARRVATFVHPYYGISVNDAGGSLQRQTPEVASVNPAASIVNWLWSYMRGDEINNHSIEKYVSALNLAAAMAVAPRLRRQAVEQPQRNVQRVVQAAERAVAAPIFARERSQNSVSVFVPMPERARAVKSGAVWNVQWRGQVIIVAGSKRKARQVARTMNKWLDAIQNGAVVDVQSILSQINGYLKNASDPVGSFQPVMTTTMPL